MTLPTLDLSPSTPAPAPASPAPTQAPRSLAALLLLAGLACGVALRLLQYAVNRSLWLDESLLATIILRPGIPGISHPLGLGQTAPIGFLLLEKTVVVLLGSGELALRLLPLLCGLGGLALAVPVARRCLTPRAVPLAVALIALCPFLVYYSSELKPYSGDLLLSLAVLGLARRMASARVSRATTLSALLLGAAAALLSQPVVFVLAGSALVLGVQALRRRELERVRIACALAFVWGLSAIISYLASRPALGDGAYLRAFWHSGFPPLPPHSLGDALWLPRALARAFREPLGIVGEDQGWASYLAAGTTLGCFLLGCAVLARTRRSQLALLLAPLGLVLLAAALRLYPFAGDYATAGRVLIFLIPTLVFPAAEGAAWLTERIARRAGVTGGRIAMALLAAAMLAPSGLYAARSVPHLRAEVKPLLLFAQDERRPGDLMYVYYNGESVFRYYAPRFGWSAAQTVYGRCSRPDPTGYLRDLQRVRGNPRVWILFVGGKAPSGYDERKLMTEYLEHVGERLDDRVAEGAALLLYDLSPGKGQPGPFAVPLPPHRDDISLGCRGPWGAH